jgi:hypothetical protein
MGNITLKLTATGLGNCAQAADSMVLSINNAPQANAGNDSTTCEGVPYTVSGASVGFANSYHWSAPGAGILVNSTTLTPTYIPAPGQIGLVTLTLTATGSDGCPTATDQMELIIVPAAVVSAGIDASICQGSSYSIIDASLQYASSPHWTADPPTAGSFDYPDTLNPIFTPVSGFTGSFVLILTANGNAPCATATDQLQLMVVPSATVSAGNNDTICETAVSYNLAEATVENSSSVLWTTSGTGTFSNIFALRPIYTFSQADISTGKVTLTVTAHGIAPCGNAADSMVLVIHRTPLANAGPDVDICATSGSYTVENATASRYHDILWTTTGTGTLTGETTFSPTYNIGLGETGMVKLTMRANPAPGSYCQPALDSPVHQH